MRSIALLAIAAALSAVAPIALTAQHCWPTAVVIVLRDSAGRAADPSKADEVAVSPGRSPEADFAYGIGPLRYVNAHPPLRVDSLPNLVWTGRGACAIDIDTVTVRRGSAVMRLLPAIHVNSLRTPAQSTWVVDTPPFRAGTYRLALCTLPTPPVNTFGLVPASAWVSADASDGTACPPGS